MASEPKEECDKATGTTEAEIQLSERRKVIAAKLAAAKPKFFGRNEQERLKRELAACDLEAAEWQKARTRVRKLNNAGAMDGLAEKKSDQDYIEQAERLAYRLDKEQRNLEHLRRTTFTPVQLQEAEWNCTIMAAWQRHFDELVKEGQRWKTEAIEGARRQMKISRPSEELTTIRLLTSGEDNITSGAASQFLAALHRFDEEIIFRLVSAPDRVNLLLTLPTCQLPHFERVAALHCRGLVFEPDEVPLWPTRQLRYFFSDPSYPIKLFEDFFMDPLAAFCQFADELQAGEAIHCVTTFKPAPPPFLNNSKASRINEEKQHHRPFWQVHLSAAIYTPDPPAGQQRELSEARASELVRMLESRYLQQYNAAFTQIVQWNAATPAANLKSHYDRAGIPEEHWHCVLMSSPELSGLVHLPPKSITSPVLERANMIDQKPPDFVTGPDGLLLGVSNYRRQNIEIRLPQNVRSRHLYTLGASGSGKSTLLLNMIVQDIDNGAGLAVIDPHGDLISKILPHIPKRRIADTILFNAADDEHPIALNPLQARSRQEQEQVRDEFMTLFQRLFVSGDAPRMLHILRFAITTLVQSGNKTFFDIRRLLINPEFRRSVLATITNQHVLEFWQQEFSNFPKGATDPIVNKLSQFTLSTTVHNILAQAQSQINFYDLMQERKIFLASLPPDIGEENSHLLGSLIVAQIQMAAMRRSAIPEQQRVPFTLYVDEFQNFMSSGFEKILSEARKYQLSLVLAHQYITQLQDNVRAAIFANTHTRIFFQVSPQDANTVRTLLGTSTPEQLVSFKRGQALVTMPACSPFILHTFPDPPFPTENFSGQITETSRQRYSTRPEPPAAPAPAMTPEPAAEPIQPLAAAFPRIRPSGRRKAPPQAAATPEPAPGSEPEANIFDELFKKP